MTRLLVSVRSAAEARLACAAGVDVIDIKEPRAGALGAAAPEVVAQVVQAVGGRCPVSVAGGELLPVHAAAANLLEGAANHHRPQPQWQGCAYAKLGLAGVVACRDWPQAWRAWIEQLGPATAPVAVAYADFEAAAAPPPEQVLRQGAALGCRVLLIDTWSKQQGDLFHWLAFSRIETLVLAAHQTGLQVALAGSLTVESLPRALTLGPDLIAVRGAVCLQGRQGALDPTAIARLQHVLQAAATA